MVNPSSKMGKGIALALVCLCLLGTMPIIANLRGEAIPALAFAFALSVWQTVFAFSVFAVELKTGERGIFASGFTGAARTRIILITVFTGTLFGLSTYLYVLGVERAGATSAAIAIQAYPLFAILWETLFLKRRKTLVELAITSLLVGTLYYLGTGGTFMLTGLSPWFLVALGVPFLWSVAHVIIKEELGRTPVTPIQVTFFRVAISTLFLFFAMAVAGTGAISDGFSALFYTMSAVMGFVYFMELIVWFYAVRFIDVSLASSITTPWPALTMALSVPLLGDRIEAYQIIALVVVVACIYGLTLAGLKKESAQ